jgi:transcriptional regulator of heat shock response
MNQRTAQILEAVMQQFIDTGEPVSSGWLYERYDFGIKPAMIRLELDALEAGGFLEQPHHSAGRIPTDAGYEFYAERVLLAEAERMRAAARRHAVAASEAAMRAVALRKLLEHRAWGDFMNELSTELGLLSVAMDSSSDEIYKTGLHALFENLNWNNHDEVRSVIRDFEGVDERLPGAAEKMGEAMMTGPQVFIGRKSPVTESENLAVVGGNYRVGDTMISIFAIGPKRMDYKKTIRIFRSL